MTRVTNLLRDLPPEPPSPGGEEIFEALLQAPGVKLERIVSHGQATPAGEWYDQAWDEWVMVLAGGARLRVAEGGEGNDEGEVEYDLGPGDAVLLPAHCRHRVTWTDPERATVWLALHVGVGVGPIPAK